MEQDRVLTLYDIPDELIVSHIFPYVILSWSPLSADTPEASLYKAIRITEKEDPVIGNLMLTDKRFYNIIKVKYDYSVQFLKKLENNDEKIYELPKFFFLCSDDLKKAAIFSFINTSGFFKSLSKKVVTEQAYIELKLYGNDQIMVRFSTSSTAFFPDAINNVVLK